VTADLFRAPSGSPAPFRTLELRATASFDSDAFARLVMRAAAARGAGPEIVRLDDADDDYDDYDDDDPDDADDRWTHYTWHVWWEPPARWRDELTHPGIQTCVALVREGAGLVYLPLEGTLYTSEPVPRDIRWDVGYAPAGTVELPTIAGRLAEFPLIRPPLPASEWVFATVGQGEVYAGRVTRRVRATRRVDATRSDETEASRGWLWPSLDEYECLVDDGLRILMRLTGIADGAPVVSVAADDVRVDETFSPDLFDFVPPPGARIVQVPPTT
jgi:hypothetical protein